MKRFESYTAAKSAADFMNGLAPVEIATSVIVSDGESYGTWGKVYEHGHVELTGWVTRKVKAVIVKDKNSCFGVIVKPQKVNGPAKYKNIAFAAKTIKDRPYACLYAHVDVLLEGGVIGDIRDLKYICSDPDPNFGPYIEL